MTVSGKSDHQIIANALDHFENILNELQDDDDVKIGNEVIKKDVEEYAKRVKDLSVDVRSENHDLKFVLNQPLVCNALMRYSKDLKASRNSLKTKLFGVQANWVVFETDNINKEIAHTEKLIDIHCSTPPAS